MKFLKEKEVFDEDDIEESSFEKILFYIILLFGIIIAIVTVVFVKLSVYSVKFDNSGVAIYSCDTADEQISVTNKKVLSYYLKYIDSVYDEVLVSPVGVQSSVYDYYNSLDEQNGSLFTPFDNGFRTWDESGRLFDNDCFITFLPNEINSKEELIGKAADSSNGFLSILGSGAEFGSDSLYSICSVGYGIKDAVYNTKDDIIYYDGVIKYKKTSDYEAVKLPLSNEDYSVYLIDGDIKNFDTFGFEGREASVAIGSYTWQSYGTMTNLAKFFGYTDSELVILNQFGFSENNHDVVNTFESTQENKYFYVSEYSVIVVDEQTGLYLMIGKKN